MTMCASASAWSNKILIKLIKQNNETNCSLWFIVALMVMSAISVVVEDVEILQSEMDRVDPERQTEQTNKPASKKQLLCNSLALHPLLFWCSYQNNNGWRASFICFIVVVRGVVDGLLGVGFALLHFVRETMDLLCLT
jgi:hypothetical protein